jgi:Flp pilus assembly protein TadD
MPRLRYALLISSSLLLLASCNDVKLPFGDKAADAPSAAVSAAERPALDAAAKLKAENKLEEAAVAYSQIVARNPKSVEASLELAAIYRKLGQSDKSLALMRAFEPHAIDNPQVLAQLGYALIDMNEPRGAIAVFDKLMAIKNNYPDAYNGKAVAFDHTGNHAAAQELYRRALNLSPGAPHIQNNLSMSLILDGKSKEAIAFLEPLYEQDKNNKVIRHNLAMAYGINGQDKKSMELNLVDLSKDQAQENLIYYKEFARRQKLVQKNIAKITDTVKPVAMPAPTPAQPVEAVAEITPTTAPQTEAPAITAEPAPQTTTDIAKPEEASPASGTGQEPKGLLEEYGDLIQFNYSYPGAKH